MAAARPFADMLARFLTVHLPVTRDCSRNTISAYRDAFTLFLRFMEVRLATPPDRVSFTDFTTPNVAAFLDWLRTAQGLLRRHRQPAPGGVEIVLPIRSNRSPRANRTGPNKSSASKPPKLPSPAIDYLPLEAIGLLLEHAKRRGPRDLALLTTL